MAQDMSLSSVGLATLGAGLLGVLSHVCIFIRGEWHMQGARLVKLYSFLATAIFVASQQLQGSIVQGLSTTGLVTSAYAVGLFTSIVIYRKFFHRLRHFPGPWFAGVTKLWHLAHCQGGQNYLYLERLHQQYGSFVRTGPEEITIIDPAVFPAIEGVRSECTKAVWYDFLLPQVTVVTTRSTAEHDMRRRAWNRGFSSKAIPFYEERIEEYAELLTRRIQDLAKRGDPVNVSEWFEWFAFDVMGEFAFARSFGMLENEHWHPAVQLLKDAMGLLGSFTPVPWLAQTGFQLVPWLSIIRNWQTMLQFCRDSMNERIQRTVSRPDVSSWLIEASEKNGTLEADREALTGDAVALIIAGSDTVSAALVFTFYELARNPEHQEQILEELRDVDIHNSKELRTCTHMNAVIKEVLRLYPGLPTGGLRQAPSQGITVGETYIPGNTTLVAPRYSIARLESSYEKAGEFVPERWTTRPEMIKDPRGYSPFAQGRFSCVGKDLAMIELRLVIALLLKKFHVEFLEGDDGKSLFDGLKDQFTAAPGRLDLRFRIRD